VSPEALNLLDTITRIMIPLFTSGLLLATWLAMRD